MGRGIAQIAAQTGSIVKLFDVQPQASNKAKAELANQWDKLVAKNRLDANTAQNQKDRVLTVATITELADCDLVIEAVLERLEFVGIEMEAEYIPIAEGRIAYWSENRPAEQGGLFE